MKAVIMAGGKGTRISSLRADIPKPMIEVCGKPVLERQIECLKENGIVDIILVIGHLGTVIRNYCGDGTQWGVHIRYIEETEPLGTAGALYYLKDMDEDFFLLNGDIIFDVDLQRMAAWHTERNARITLFAHPNSHPYDSVLIKHDGEGKVTTMGKVQGGYPRNCVNAGIHIVSPEVLQGLHELKARNFDQEIVKPQIEHGTVFAYRSPEYVHDMGTPERYYAVCRDVASGLVRKRNLRYPQKAIFLDRDGTINKEKGYITAPEQLELESGAAEAIRRINQSEYLAIVVTNQPVIARGDCSLEELDQIHGRLDQLLGEQGAYLDDLLFCPHHPDRGFPGEVLEYKIPCSCRKPEPGMLLQAAKRYHIDLNQSFMIGDDERDMMAGRRAGCDVLQVSKNRNLYSAVLSIFA